MQNIASPIVSVVGGSKSDFPLLRKSISILEEFGIPSELKVVSAHRTPHWLFQFAGDAEGRGTKVIIAGAGGAAHLPGMIAAKTVLPVIGVPVPLEHLKGMDSLLSIVQMPRGLPVATVAIAGAENAAILALEIIGVNDLKVRKQLKEWRNKTTESILSENSA